MMAKLQSDYKWCCKRLLALHATAKVGHLGGNLSCLPGLCAVVNRLMGQDRLVLPKGHSAGALYVALARAGLIPEDELDSFHQNGTRLPGHPPSNIFDAIPFATGSLGHGLSLAAGFALSQQMRNSDGKTYCITSDGEWQEGSTWEALIFASHHLLRNLTVLIDHNCLQGFGTTNEVASMDPIWERIKGFRVHVDVVDGHNLQDISEVLEKEQPMLRIIVLRTIKGKGIHDFEGKLQSHYLPLSEVQYRNALKLI